MNIDSSLPTKEQLPSSFAIYADNLSAISVTGEEADKYLQGQLTCDVNQLAEKHLLVGGHCDAKGKLFSAFRLINHFEQRLLIQNKLALNESLAQLNKFGVFAKVDINEATDLDFLALVGDEAKAFINDNFHSVPDSFNPVVNDNGVSIVYICGATNRYLIIAKQDKVKALASATNLPVFGQKVWSLLEITSGFVDMNAASVNEYVPQMLNLQLVNGISFTKGCYLGQETVARMKYLGRNKKALYALQTTGDTKWQLDVEINEQSALEKQLGDNWRNAGNIISHYQADDGTIYVQAVLANDTEENAVLRLKHQNGIKFSLMPLPYSLQES
ncbi:tRNA-modifying protein YgfZ [Thalassomonas sp. M1454]|uniref:tRNA-modifying protein YgfZ n=1 Tax=Thalassomonas sp. M1454 TaxID=2594477 RepID=UPI00117F5BF7|nr:tRNA-modifying protein YgfZ [Thalassomonas sp. M1454]TRX54538.1 tRNA-modifying protein YgfZ [Thalassomonas sp. M1454]